MFLEQVAESDAKYVKMRAKFLVNPSFWQDTVIINANSGASQNDRFR
jgi:hypothetical protein